MERGVKDTMATDLPIHHLQQGSEAFAAGDLAAARRHFLKAARHLLAQAQKAPSPGLRQRRFAQAQQVMEQVQRLEHELAARGRGAAAISATEEDPEPPPWLLAERPRIRFTDVAGLEDVKTQIRLKLIYPFTHPEQAHRFGLQPGGGILLYGPPGTGKTYIARAVAGELSASFFIARASDLMSRWFGEAERNLAALFAAARQHPPAVIFLDEVEALVPNRSTTRSSVMPRVVSEFLAQTQGIQDGDDRKGVLLLGATNEPWAIDPAALRPGRFDELIYVGLPDAPARRRLLEIALRDRPLAPDVDPEELVRCTEGYSGADIVHLCRKAGERAFLASVEFGTERPITWDDFQRVLDARGPSVDPAQLRRYEEFRRRRRPS